MSKMHIVLRIDPAGTEGHRSAELVPNREDQSVSEVVDQRAAAGGSKQTRGLEDLGRGYGFPIDFLS